MNPTPHTKGHTEMLACTSPFLSIAVFIGAVCTVLVVAAILASWRENRK